MEIYLQFPGGILILQRRDPFTNRRHLFDDQGPDMVNCSVLGSSGESSCTVSAVIPSEFSKQNPEEVTTYRRVT